MHFDKHSTNAGSNKTLFLESFPLEFLLGTPQSLCWTHSCTEQVLAGVSRASQKVAQFRSNVSYSTVWRGGGDDVTETLPLMGTFQILIDINKVLLEGTKASLRFHSQPETKIVCLFVLLNFN